MDMKTALVLIPLSVCMLLNLTQAAEPGLEEQFAQMLTNATLDGRNIPLKEGALGEAGGDRYKIVSTQKVDGNQWQITYMARIQGQVVPVPIPVTIEWAGDTAILIVNDLQGYSARVLFHPESKTYAGTWSGNNQAGLISGLVKATE